MNNHLILIKTVYFITCNPYTTMLSYFKYRHCSWYYIIIDNKGNSTETHFEFSHIFLHPSWLYSIKPLIFRRYFYCPIWITDVFKTNPFWGHCVKHWLTKMFSTISQGSSDANDINNSVLLNGLNELHWIKMNYTRYAVHLDNVLTCENNCKTEYMCVFKSECIVVINPGRSQTSSQS